MIRFQKNIVVRVIPLILLVGFLFAGCKSDEFKPEDSFIKVYDHSDINRNYFPLGMTTTSDNGYLIMSAYDGNRIHLLKTNELGDFLWEYDLPEQFTSAIPNLIEKNGTVYFMCMDAVGLFTYVMQVDEGAQNASVYQPFSSILYPLAWTDNGNSVYIQNYERNILSTGVYELNGTLDQVVDSADLEIYVDVELEIIDHLNYTGKRFPFFITTTPESDYIVFNGFNNYSFSSVFLDASMDFSGVYSGAAFDGGLNAMLPLGGNQFALSRFSFSDIYTNPNVSLSPTALDVAESIPSVWASELDSEAPILIKNLSVNGTEYAAYLATTKSNQLVLSLYSKTTGELAASKYIGESVPMQGCDFLETPDGGLMILTQATVMSSFNRIATIKLSKEELELLLD
ncbi:MAG: hypothetical protein AB8B56_08850 [Crocinitomicaceae bacterium]